MRGVTFALKLVSAECTPHDKTPIKDYCQEHDWHYHSFYPCSSVRYNTHLYRLALQAGFYRDAVEYWISTQEIPRFESQQGQKGD